MVRASISVDFWLLSLRLRRNSEIRENTHDSKSDPPANPQHLCKKQECNQGPLGRLGLLINNRDRISTFFPVTEPVNLQRSQRCILSKYFLIHKHPHISHLDPLVHTRMHTCMYIHTHVCIRMLMHAYTDTYIHTYSCSHIHTYTLVLVHAYTHMYMHVLMHA